MFLFHLEVNRKNLGCCIVEVDDPNDANERCKQLDLMPNECNQARGYLLDENGFKKQNMELNRFYSSAEMRQKGFKIS